MDVSTTRSTTDNTLLLRSNGHSRSHDIVSDIGTIHITVIRHGQSLLISRDTCCTMDVSTTRSTTDNTRLSRANSQGQSRSWDHNETAQSCNSKTDSWHC